MSLFKVASVALMMSVSPDQVVHVKLLVLYRRLVHMKPVPLGQQRLHFILVLVHKLLYFPLLKSNRLHLKSVIGCKPIALLEPQFVL